mmetsp:Transcript_4243/g.4847  ORF Transcript_4243/g.4847 Transcript_4243/m.4847 type:complete len:80 (+) Transcript_4243:229-468(+)
MSPTTTLSSLDENFLISSHADDYDQERRFRWHIDLGRSAEGVAATRDAYTQFNAVNENKLRSKYGNHQTNYSATKYIKP